MISTFIIMSLLMFSMLSSVALACHDDLTKTREFMQAAQRCSVAEIIR